MKFNEIDDRCGFFEEKTSTIQYFFSKKMEGDAFDFVLELGFRKFGIFFFRYLCPGCGMCNSIRVNVGEFILSSSQKRVLRKNRDLVFSTSVLSYKDEYYALYRKHHESRFGKGKIADMDEFHESFCISPAKSYVTEIRLEEKLIGAGFADEGDLSLSSSYFVFDPEFQKRSIGTYSMIKEIQLAHSMGKRYYYPGYCIKGKKFSDYKSHFRPHQIYLMPENRWIEEAEFNNMSS